MRARLKELKDKHALVGNVRGRGLMIGIETVHPVDKSPNVEAGSKLELELFKRGVVASFSTFASVLRILPSLTIEREEIDYAVEVLDESLKNVAD